MGWPLSGSDDLSASGSAEEQRPEEVWTKEVHYTFATSLQTGVIKVVAKIWKISKICAACQYIDFNHHICIYSATCTY